MKYSKPKVGEKVRKGDLLLLPGQINISGIDVCIKISLGTIYVSGNYGFRQNSSETYYGWTEHSFRKAPR